MTPVWEQQLIAAVKPFGLPVYQLTYNGSAQTYFVFNAEEIPANFGDDAPEHELVLIQLHLYTTAKHNTTRLKRDIKRAISEAGFTYPQATIARPRQASEGDGEGQHIVFEFQAAEWVGEAE